MRKLDRQACFNEPRIKDYFAQQDDIDFVLIFGSTALGRGSPLSDIDIAIYFKGDNDVLRLGERQIDITCKMMSTCKLNRVDVVVLNCANPFLKYQVIKYGRLIYAKDVKLFHRFKAASLGRYQDIRPMYELYDRIAEINLRRGMSYMLDIPVVRGILSSLNDGLEHLKSKQNISPEQFKRDRDIQAIIERRLETSIQACIDIGNHIISSENMGSLPIMERYF